jgi:hypothetical protein
MKKHYTVYLNDFFTLSFKDHADTGQMNVYMNYYRENESAHYS